MLFLSKPDADTIEAFIAHQARLPFSYDDVGRTGSAVPTDAYHVDHNRVRLGAGGETFERAVAAVRGWKMFDLPHVSLCWPTAPIAVGTTVAILAHYGAFWLLNACRIVYTADDDRDGARRFGFAYGTLPAHVARGEERFLIEWRRDSDEVCYDILAFSTPSLPLMTIVSPLLRRQQRRFAQGSKEAMVSAVGRALHIKS